MSSTAVRVAEVTAIFCLTTWRRELFYWAAVAATFATGTAVGDLTAIPLHLGYAGSIVLFAAAICIPAAGYRWLRWNPTASFWGAYVLTQPLGASIADRTGKSTRVGGVGWGDGPMSLAFVLVIVGSLPHAARGLRRIPQPR